MSDMAFDQAKKCPSCAEDSGTGESLSRIRGSRLPNEDARAGPEGGLYVDSQKRVNESQAMVGSFAVGHG
jgi:hypothetical protein